jgi:peptide/nickel transport system ATP-binding protein
VFPRRVGLWRRDDVIAVDDVSFKLFKGQTLGIVGESGSGKSTTGLCVVRLHQATAGEVLFEGTDLRTMSEAAFMPLKRRLQIVFQNPYASLNPRFTVGQILTEPMRLHGIGSNALERESKLKDLLDRVALPASSVNRYPHEFSGGQRQRIAIARCLALEPDVIVCDEAVSALDVSVQAQVLNLFKDLQRELSLSYLFISHDLGVVRYMADALIVMHQGRVVEQGSADSIYSNPHHDYTRELLRSVPRGFQS